MPGTERHIRRIAIDVLSPSPATHIMHFVYVPYFDKEMDAFAKELTSEKNKAKWRITSRHQLIPRGADAVLSVVRPLCRLYVLVHGDEKRSGYVGNIAAGADLNDAQRGWTLRPGNELADELIRKGLPNKTIDIRLWTCWSANHTPAAEHTTDLARTFDADCEFGRAFASFTVGARQESVALRLASRLKECGYKKCSVTGYTKEVNISITAGHEALLMQGHKSVFTDGGAIERVTSAHRVTYRVRAV